MDWLRKTVTLLLFFFGGRQTMTAMYCSTSTLSQWGTTLYSLELNWMLVMNTVSSRLATIRARLTEKKTSAGKKTNKQTKNIRAVFCIYTPPLHCVMYERHESRHVCYGVTQSLDVMLILMLKPDQPSDHSSPCRNNYSCTRMDTCPTVAHGNFLAFLQTNTKNIQSIQQPNCTNFNFF